MSDEIVNIARPHTCSKCGGNGLSHSGSDVCASCHGKNESQLVNESKIEFAIEPAILIVEHGPEKVRHNCKYCGHPSEGLKLNGVNCCWFCQRKPIMRTPARQLQTNR